VQHLHPPPWGATPPSDIANDPVYGLVGLGRKQSEVCGIAFHGLVIRSIVVRGPAFEVVVDRAEGHGA